MRILVTGANGFVGRSLTRALAETHDVVGAVRKHDASLTTETIVVGDIAGPVDWRPALADVDVIVHLAARVHVINEKRDDALSAYRSVNTAATRRLATAAAEAGVRRFVFLSSIKVNGESTTTRPFSNRDQPNPRDPYGVSKLEAETALRDIASETGLGLAILRPPVIYGPGVGGNIQRIAKLISRRVPLPLASVKNRRTMLSIDNLITWTTAAVEVDPAGDLPVLLGDPRPVSTAELVREIGAGLGATPTLIPFPPTLLRAAGRAVGRAADVARLVEDLEIVPSLSAFPNRHIVLRDPAEALRECGAWIAQKEPA